MTRQKVFTDTKWLGYLICCGQGVGELTPFVLADVKELCLHTQASTDDVVGDAGAFHIAQTCCIFSEHCALPPAEKSPSFAICGKKIKVESRPTGSVLQGKVFNADTFWNEPFWCYYCFFTGCAVHAPGKTGQLVASQFKSLCCAGSTILEMPAVDGVWCSDLSTFLCCWKECQLPPAAGNPKVACCIVYKMNNDHSAASTTPPGEPKQVEMT